MIVLIKIGETYQEYIIPPENNVALIDLDNKTAEPVPSYIDEFAKKSPVEGDNGEFVWEDW